MQRDYLEMLTRFRVGPTIVYKQKGASGQTWQCPLMHYDLHKPKHTYTFLHNRKRHYMRQHERIVAVSIGAKAIFTTDTT